MRNQMAAAAVLMLLTSCAHQQFKTTSVAPTLAVGFPAENGPDGEVLAWQLAIPANGGVGTEMSGDSLRPLPGTDPHAGPPLTLALDFTAHGNKVTAIVYTIPPESDPLRWSDGHKHLLGRWSARLNEAMELKELKRIGYQPISLKIVKFVPPPPAHPALVSKAPSIRIALAAGDDMASYLRTSGDKDTQSCTVVLHNVSSLGVVACVLRGDPKAGIAMSREEHATLGRPVIAPQGDSRKEFFTFGHAGRMTPQGFVKLPAQPQQIIVEAAIFSDGSYEGDENVAAGLVALEVGTSTVNRLMQPVIDGIVRDQSMNDEARTARIKDEIFHISSQPDRAATRSIHSQFPDLPTKDVVADLTRGLDAAKNQIWGDLYGYMHNCCQYPPPDHISLAEWWHMRQRIGIQVPNE